MRSRPSLFRNTWTASSPGKVSRPAFLTWKKIFAADCQPPEPGQEWLSVGYEYCHDIQRSEEHTSELQSRPHLVCRLLLEKKNTKNNKTYNVYQSQSLS